MIKVIVAWLSVSLVGVLLVVLLPDDLLGNQIVFRLSNEHGPTLADSVGILCILGAWVYYLANLWIRRKALLAKKATWWLIGFIVLGVVGSIVAATQNANGFLIAVSSISLVAQIILGILAGKADR
ncbi:MAG TPA: hypothetical protein VLA77_01330 [Candidatus Saccharimonadales bacterium]|nr:hypothetical protein [Candidatus Saccharimonadales bacterium]